MSNLIKGEEGVVDYVAHRNLKLLLKVELLDVVRSVIGLLGKDGPFFAKAQPKEILESLPRFLWK